MKPQELLLFFTFYSFILAALTTVVNFSPATLDIIRAMVFIVAISVAYIYLRYGPAVMDRFYQRLFPATFTEPWIALVFDALIHFAPVAVVGLPRTGTGLVIGYAAMVLWYLLIQYTVGIDTVYSKEIPCDVYEDWTMIGIPATLLALHVYNNL